jgi:CRP/FNR family cyclic AMP-dependent transcriptional regulator
LENEARSVAFAGWLGSARRAFSDALLQAGSLKRFENGDVVYGLGQSQDCLWCVVSGLARMWITMNEQPPRFGHVAGPGFWFGEVEVTTKGPRIIEVEAHGDTVLLMVAGRDFRQVASEFEDAWRELARLAVANLALAIGAADDLMIRDPKQRLAAVLLRLASHRSAFQGVAPIPFIPATQSEIAAAANLSRASAAAILAELVESGAIATEYRRIRLTNPERLKSIVHE